MSYEETSAGWIRAAYGITEPDRAAVLERREEIRRLAGLNDKEISKESAEAVARAQLAPRPLITDTVEGWNQRMRSTYPYWQQDGVMSLNDGVCWTTTGPDGETVWHGGSPQLRAAVAESRRRDRERELAALAGPVARQIR